MNSLLKKLEWGFRHRVVYPLLRLVLRNQRFDGVIDLSQVKKILILRYDRIGDMIVTTPIFRKLKQVHPSVEIAVFASPTNAEIVRFNKNVNRVYVLHRNWWRLFQEVLLARRESYDAVLNFVFNRTTSGALLANLIAPSGIKVGQGAEKYGFYYNRLLTLPRATLHMTMILADYVHQTFGIAVKDEEMVFEIAIDPESQHYVNSFLQRHGLQERPSSLGRSRYVVFNPSAKESTRRLSYEQASTILTYLTEEKGLQTVVIVAPGDEGFRQRVMDTVNSDRSHAFPDDGRATLLGIAALIQRARCVVTPETSIIHFASATRTPVLGFFLLAHEDEWLPFNVKHAIVRSPGHFPVSAIPISEIESALDSFLNNEAPNA